MLFVVVPLIGGVALPLLAPGGVLGRRTNYRCPNRTWRCLPWLQVFDGRVVVAGTGKPVLLRGANIMESEWRNNVRWERLAIPQLAHEWHGNIVIHGFAANPVNSHDKHYLHLLDQYVALTGANRMYVVFSWRSYTPNGPQPPYPDVRARSALAILAARYRGDPHVMFSLQVEPHQVSWTWLRPVYERMIDAVRKAAAPYRPLIFVPGTAWGKDISGAIADPVKRPNIVYTSHPYTSAGAFDRYFGAAVDTGLPVFIGEFGPTPDMTMSDVRVLLAYARQHRIGWAAWGFEYDASPSLVTRSLRRTVPYGGAVQDAMLPTRPLAARWLAEQ